MASATAKEVVLSARELIVGVCLVWPNVESQDIISDEVGCDLATVIE